MEYQTVACRRVICAIVLRAARDYKSRNGYGDDAVEFLASDECAEWLEVLGLPSGDDLVKALDVLPSGKSLSVKGLT